MKWHNLFWKRGFYSAFKSFGPAPKFPLRIEVVGSNFLNVLYEKMKIIKLENNFEKLTRFQSHKSSLSMSARLQESELLQFESAPDPPFWLKTGKWVHSPGTGSASPSSSPPPWRVGAGFFLVEQGWIKLILFRSTLRVPLSINTLKFTPLSKCPSSESPPLSGQP